MTDLTEDRMREIAMQEIRNALLDFANHCDGAEDAIYSAARAAADDVEERMTRPRERPAPTNADAVSIDARRAAMRMQPGSFDPRLLGGEIAIMCREIDALKRTLALYRAHVDITDEECREAGIERPEILSAARIAERRCYLFDDELSEIARAAMPEFRENS